MPVDVARVVGVLVLCVALVVGSGAWAYAMRTDRDVSLLRWLDQDITAASIVIGMAAGVVFGCMDNLLLMIGITSLDSVLKNLPFGNDSSALAGYGNAFSGFVSLFVSTFLSRGLASTTGVDPDKAPLWASSMGLVLGSVIGIVLPRLVQMSP